MPRLELKLLGNLEILIDGSPITGLKSRKAQALLCYLATTRKSHSREWLAGMFWGGMPENKARMNLSQALSTLRRSFEEHLSSDRYTVSLQPGSQIWTDTNILKAANFDDLPSLQHAAQLFRGDFLEGFYIPDSPDFEFWMLAERANYRERILQVLDHLVNHYIQQGEQGCSSAIMFSKQRLGIEPWHEETHRSLMRLYSSTGQRNKALKQYEECRKILLAELGVEPGYETSEIYNCLREKPSSRLHPAEDSLVSEYPNNLPHQPTEFIGRQQELDQLQHLILDQGAPIVTLTGLGGIGKTRLAIEFVSQLAKSAEISRSVDHASLIPFPDGVFFVPLEALKLPDDILSAVASAVNFRLDADNQQVFQYLHSKRLILIIDNFEHVLAGKDILATLLEAAPKIQILVTSRESLGLYGEQIFPLPGLNYPPALGHEFVDFAAGELFIKAARRHNPAYQLSAADHEHLLRICQLVEGMPLALEIAASWTKVLPLSSIADHIWEDLQFLQVDSGILPARQRSLHAIIERTISTFPDHEQRLFFKLAVFSGGFTLQAAEFVAGANYHHLAELLDKSLLRYSLSDERYSLHPLVHQFMLKRISADPKTLHETNLRHSLFFCQWFAEQTQPSRLRSQGQQKVVDGMSSDLDNVLNAWNWALHHHHYERLIGKTDSLGLYYIWRGGYVEGANKFQVLVDAIREFNSTGDQYQSLLFASVSNWLAFFLDILGRSSMALQILQSSKELLDSPSLTAFDTRAQRAHNLSIFTRVYQSIDRISRSDLLSQAVELYRQADHRFGLPFALTTLARFKIAEGDQAAAENHLHESLDIYQQSGNDIGQAFSLVGLGNLAFIKNDYGRAKQFYTSSIEIASASNSPERVIAATMFRGIAHFFSGQFDSAMADLNECVHAAQERGLPGFQAFANYYMGYASLHLGNYHQVAEYVNSALPLAEQTGEYEMSDQLSMLLAAVNLAKGDHSQPINGFQAARKFHMQRNFLQIIYGENCGVFGLACTELENGNIPAARQLLVAYLKQAIEVQRLDLLNYALCGHVKLNQFLGDSANAIFIWRMISNSPFIHNSRWLIHLTYEPLRIQFPEEHESWHTQIEQRSIWEIASNLLDNS